MTIQAKTRFSYKVNPKKYCFTKQPCFMLIGWVILEASLLLLLLKSSMQTHIGGPCSSPVEGDEGWINPNLKLCLWQKKKCIIPYIFNNWANSVVHLLLLKSSMDGHTLTSVTRLGNILYFGQLFKAFGEQLICPNLPHS